MFSTTCYPQTNYQILVNRTLTTLLHFIIKKPLKVESITCQFIMFAYNHNMHFTIDSLPFQMLLL